MIKNLVSKEDRKLFKKRIILAWVLRKRFANFKQKQCDGHRKSKRGLESTRRSRRRRGGARRKPRHTWVRCKSSNFKIFKKYSHLFDKPDNNDNQEDITYQNDGQQKYHLKLIFINSSDEEEYQDDNLNSDDIQNQ